MTQPRPACRRFACLLWSEWIRPLALPMLFILSAKSSLADINYVPSGSMKPTILEGDVLFINKLAYDLRVPFTTWRVARWDNPTPGDIVVCFSPADGTRLVKRVVALPDDTIEMRNEILYLNGARLDYAPLDPAAIQDLDPRERTNGVFAREQLGARPHAVMARPDRPALRSFGPVRVPAGHYFMLGDNRDNSNDSRFIGFVPRAEIIGRATTVVASGDLENWLRPRFGRFFSPLL